MYLTSRCQIMVCSQLMERGTSLLGEGWVLFNVM